jgi:hypothetical protein
VAQAAVLLVLLAVQAAGGGDGPLNGLHAAPARNVSRSTARLTLQSRWVAHISGIHPICRWLRAGHRE